MTQESNNKKKMMMNLDDIRDISPMKLDPIKRSSGINSNNKRVSIARVDQIPSIKISITPQEARHINELASELRQLQYIKLVIIKVYQCLQKEGFFKNASFGTQRNLKMLQKSFQKTLDVMRQERLSRIDAQDIQLARPNQDIFGLFKQKYMSVMFKQREQIFKLKEKFNNNSIKFTTEGKVIKKHKELIEQLILSECQRISHEQFEKYFTPIVQKQNNIQKNKMNERINQLKKRMFEAIYQSQFMMYLKNRGQQIQKLKKNHKRQIKQKYMKKRFGDNEVNLFKIEKLFYK